MLIQRILEDENGTTVTMRGGFTYHFKPRHLGGPHVCEVSEPEHIERFLSIPEGYREAAEQPAEPARTEGDTPFFETKSGMTITANGVATFPPVVLGAEPTEPTEPTEATEPTEPTEAAPKPPVLADMPDDELRAHYVKVVGKAPHHKAGREKLIQQIEAVKSAQ